MSWFSRLVERRMKKAVVEGQLQGLSGEGEPLPDRTGDAFVDPGLAAGYRIMSENGVVPEEFRIKKEIEAHKAEMAKISDPAERKKAMAKLADLDMKLGIAIEARRKFHGQ